jgi:hypothetical protein
MNPVAIDRLSRAEKLSLMEALWRDISVDENTLSSPDWHADALREAETALAQGKAQMVDWGTAKETLRQQHLRS